MNSIRIHIRFIFVLFFATSFYDAAAQYKVKGTVYDSSRTIPIEAVTVLATNGKVTMTDSTGRYQVDVRERDSIWFSYQGKPTPKYPVLKIADVTQFDIALRLKVDVMQEVRIRTRSYKADSIQNRKDYKKIFDFQRPNLGTMTSIGPMGAGIDINELIRLFQFRRNAATVRFQQRLVQEERDKFIDRRFNRILVRRLTNLEDEQLEEFMKTYRPDFEFASATSDYDFQSYIKRAAENYKMKKRI